MTIARRRLADLEQPLWAHCILRTVRQARVVTPQTIAYRLPWIIGRLQHLGTFTTCDVAAYAILEGSVHLVLRCDPPAAEALSEAEVVRRWAQVFPGVRATPANEWSAQHGPDDLASRIEDVQRDRENRSAQRQQLGAMASFMRAFAEALGRRINRDDGCRGHFWDGRYRSIFLLDPPAILAAMVYLDLAAWRHHLAPEPTTSVQTSLGLRLGRSEPAAAWLYPVTALGTTLTHDDYRALLRGTLKILDGSRKDDARVRTLVESLGLDCERWIAVMRAERQMENGILGLPDSCRAEAERRQRSWVRSPCPLFARR